MVIRIHMSFPIVVILIVEEEISTKANRILFIMISTFESIAYIILAGKEKERKRERFFRGYQDFSVAIISKIVIGE